MTIENQVAAVEQTLITLATNVQALTEAVGKLSAPTITVDLSPVLSAVAAIDAKVSTVLADITDPADTKADAANTGETKAA